MSFLDVNAKHPVRADFPEMFAALLGRRNKVAAGLDRVQRAVLRTLSGAPSLTHAPASGPFNAMARERASVARSELSISPVSWAGRKPEFGSTSS